MHFENEHRLHGMREMDAQHVAMTLYRIAEGGGGGS